MNRETREVIKMVVVLIISMLFISYIGFCVNNDPIINKEYEIILYNLSE